MCTVVKPITLLLFFVALVIAPRSIQAGPKEEARKHYDRAVELVDDNQLAEAVVEFQRSYDLTKHYSVLYNIGQVYVSLSKPVEAIAAYEGYLVTGGKSVPAERRLEVEKEIAKQKTRIATLTIRTVPDGATIKVDGNVIGISPLATPLVLKIGEHVITASAENYEGKEVKVTLAGEDRRNVDLTLKAKVEKKVEVITPVVVPVPVTPVEVTPPQPTAVTVIEPAKKERSMTGLQTVGVISGVAGLVAAGTATVCWILAKGKHDDAVTLWNKRTDDKRANDLQGQSNDFVQYGNISMIAGGTLVALGTLLYVVGREDESATTPGTQARFAPTVGNGYAGMTVGGNW